MSVDFRGVEVAVAEQLLDVTDAGAATQEMRRAAVTEGMHRGFDFRLQRVVADAVGDAAVTELTS